MHSHWEPHSYTKEFLLLEIALEEAKSINNYQLQVDINTRLGYYYSEIANSKNDIEENLGIENTKTYKKFLGYSAIYLLCL